MFFFQFKLYLQCSPTSSSNFVSKTYAPQQSVLKPLIRLPLGHGTSVFIRSDVAEQTNPKVQTPKYIQGVKLIRNSSGKLVLVPDTSPLKKSPLSPGVKVTIKNNKIQSISRNIMDTNSDSTNVRVQNDDKDEKVDKTEEQMPVLEDSTSESNADDSATKETLDELPPVIDLCSEYPVIDSTPNNNLDTNEGVDSEPVILNYVM